MTKDMMKDTMVSPFLHVSIAKGMVTTQIIVSRSLANPTWFPIVSRCCILFIFWH